MLIPEGALTYYLCPSLGQTPFRLRNPGSVTEHGPYLRVFAWVTWRRQVQRFWWTVPPNEPCSAPRTPAPANVSPTNTSIGSEPVADPEFPRRGRQPLRFGKRPIIWQDLTKNCTKIKIEPEGDVSLAPLLEPPMRTKLSLHVTRNAYCIRGGGDGAPTPQGSQTLYFTNFSKNYCWLVNIWYNKIRVREIAIFL